nr:PREDICTED: olfactory receptor 8U8-like [Apteryx mantelli mantelli]
MGNLNYDRPSSGYSPEVDTLVSVLYCVVIPMLNPLIYSLRNQEVQGALRKIACSNTHPSEAALHAASVFVGISPFLFVVVSYLRILATVLAMPTAVSRRKAFSTCTAHLLVVALYYGMANLNYDRPSSGYSPEVDTLVSVLYCVVIPMLNPLIYSLRNQEVQGALRKIACSNTHPSEAALHAASVFVGISPFLFVVVSYLRILATVLAMPTAVSRRKAFSTCTAHLLVVALYYGMGNLNYDRPSSGYSPEVDTLVSVLYCVVIPMLNPLIYSLRNQEVQGALRKVLQGLWGSLGSDA